jgi:hypothetical protein
MSPVAGADEKAEVQPPARALPVQGAEGDDAGDVAHRKRQAECAVVDERRRALEDGS